ncbi:MAG: hypothetical protein LUG91_00780, partial [Ruminococcus sp.]|nr:hypothetical protein [Ruminococcus sp.]
MAEYRMIGKSIINTAKFLRLARTVRELYLHLIIWADDAGVTEAFPVMKLIDAKEKDLKILSEKKFIEILDEDEFIVSIVDWEEHNKIPPSKAKESRYTYLLEAKRSEPEAKRSELEAKRSEPEAKRSEPEAKR